jgi:hypothetical protein
MMRAIAVGLGVVLALGVAGCKKADGECKDARIAAGNAWFAYSELVKKRSNEMLGMEPEHQEALNAVNTGKGEAAAHLSLASDACQAAKDAVADPALAIAELRTKESAAREFIPKLDAAVPKVLAMPGMTDELREELSTAQKALWLYAAGDSGKVPDAELREVAALVQTAMCDVYTLTLRADALVKAHYDAVEGEVLAKVDAKTAQREELTKQWAEAAAIGELAMAGGAQAEIDARVAKLGGAEDSEYTAAVDATAKRAKACK